MKQQYGTQGLPVFRGVNCEDYGARMLGSLSPGRRCLLQLLDSGGGGAEYPVGAGNGSLSRMMEFLDFRCLDAVIISHLHPDHYLDLFPLRHAIEGARRDGSLAEPLKLILPSMPVQAFQVLEGYKKAFETTPVEELPLEQSLSGTPVRRLDLGKLSICFVPIKHSLPGYAISLQGPENWYFPEIPPGPKSWWKSPGGADLF